MEWNNKDDEDSEQAVNGEMFMQSGGFEPFDDAETNTDIETIERPKRINQRYSKVKSTIKTSSGPSTDFNYFMQTAAGKAIVNAVNGNVYPDRVGSTAEKKFWRVNIAYENNNCWESVKLFYDSPEQYEKHRGIEISKKTKAHWRNSL